jgi:hypothetical protein
VRQLRPLLAACAVLLITASAAQAAPLYPDMKTLPPRDLRFDVSGSQHILRFSNTAWNDGQGPLIVGNTVPSGAASVPALQTVRDSNGTTQQFNVGSYTIHAEHQHFHYDDWGRYELWSKGAFDAWVAAGRPAGAKPDHVGEKTTSCMLDEEFITTKPGTPYPRVWLDNGCDASSGKINSGLSVGWGDTYDYYRGDQYVPIGTSKLADGEYVLRSIADPDNKVYESASKSDPLRESPEANEGIVRFRVAGGVIVDTDRPTGTITVNAVDAKTASTSVRVQALGRDDVAGVQSVRLSNDGVTWSPNITYGGAGSTPMTINWDLADTRYGGSTTAGVRTVYAQFLDKSGKWSATELDTIELTTGTAPPGGGTDSAYRRGVLEDGPVGYWRLGETLGTSAVDELGTLHGSYQNGVFQGATSLLVSDPTNRSSTFDGADDQVSVPSNAKLNFGSALSLEAWIKPSSLPTAGNFASIVTRPEAYSLQFNGPQLEFTIVQGGVRKRLKAPIGAVQAGKAYHVMGTYNGMDQKLYLDGIEVGTAPLTGPADLVSNQLMIGAWWPGTENFHGTIDDVAVYDKLLTGLQAKRRYDSGVATIAGVATPTGLAATAPSSTQVNLTWADNATNETGYVVQRATSSAFTSPTTINLGANATSYSDTGRAAGTAYWYRVQAVNATESSAYSNVASVTTPGAPPPPPATPAAPSGLAATATSATQVTLAWADNATNETGYVLERSAASTFTAPTAITLPAGATSYSDTGRTASTTYWYRVRALNGTATSEWSNSASATTPAAPAPPPAAPSSLTATVASGTQVNLAWVDNATNETGYTLERATESAFATPTAIALPAGATSYADSGRTTGTTYWYRVRAANASGASAWSNSVSATPTATLPPPPPKVPYANEVAADAPVSHWRLGEATGTVAADARNANRGTYRGGPTLNATSLLSADTLSKAVRFDGADDYVDVPDSASLDLTSAITLETWIRPEALPAAGTWASVLTKAESYSLQFNGPVLEFTLMQSGARRRLPVPAGTIAAGRTYHVVATYDGATQRLFVNGAQVASRAQTGPATVTTWPLTIASWAGWGENFRGTVDDVAVYAKALAATRVQAHYTAAGPVTTATAAGTRAARTFSLKRRSVRRAALGPAQRRTFARRGPGKPRSRPLPRRGL